MESAPKQGFSSSSALNESWSTFLIYLPSCVDGEQVKLRRPAIQISITPCISSSSLNSSCSSYLLQGLVFFSLDASTSTSTTVLLPAASCVVGSDDDGDGGSLGGLMDRLRSMPPQSSSSLLWQAPLVSGEQLERAASWSWPGRLLGEAAAVTLSGRCVFASMPRARSFRLMCVFQ